MEFIMEYTVNPIRYSFKRNGKELNENSKIVANANEKLEILLKPTDNWKGLLEEIFISCNTSKINFLFYGEQQSYTIIQQSLDNYDKKSFFNLKFMGLKENLKISNYSNNKKQKNFEKSIIQEKSANERRENKSMQKFYIEYNPYILETVFKKNDIELKGESNFHPMKDKRIQYYLLPITGENWAGLPQEICKVLGNPSQIEVTFKGRKIDFDDVDYCLRSYMAENQKVNFQIIHIETKKEEDIIDDLDKIVEEIKKKNLPEFNRKKDNGKTIFDVYKDVKDEMLEISVIATMSSGKSTLINSLLRTELLPAANEATTARITNIINNDSMKNFEAESYDANWGIVNKKTVVDSEKLKEYNQNKRIKFIEMEGNIPGIRNSKVKLLLRDTPGTNNSQNDEHEKFTFDVVDKDNGVVLYIINATQFAIDDDKNLLQYIAEKMKQGGKQARDRFIFVINKCDELDEEKGESIDKTISKVRDYLLGVEINNPIIIPTSARLALLIHKQKNGQKITMKENSDLSMKNYFVEEEKLHYENYATLTPTIKDKLLERVENFHNNGNIDDEVLIHTGVPVVEETIMEFIDKYAYPMKISDSVMDIIKIFEEIDMMKKLKEKIAKGGADLDRLRSQIAEAKKKHSDSEPIYEEYKKDIEAFCLDKNLRIIFSKYVDMKLGKIVERYTQKEKVDKTEVDGIIEKFKDELSKFQKECEEEVNRKLRNEIYDKGSQMLNNYKNQINKILTGLNIDNFDFKKISSFDKIIIGDINTLIKENESTRYRTETRRKENPNAKGFFGFFRRVFKSEPKEISYEVCVKDGINVDVNKVINTIITEYKKDVYTNIEEILDIADKQIMDYKKIFTCNLDILKNEINSILLEIEEKSNDKNNVEEELNKNSELYKWVSEKDSQFKNLLNF